MYYPYFRGKQFELILLREQASFLCENNIHPIIEPVRSNLSPLKRSIERLIERNTNFILIINPQVGDLKENPAIIYDDLIENYLSGVANCNLGLIVNSSGDPDSIKELVESKSAFNFSLIHYGFDDGQILSEKLNSLQNIKEHIYIEGKSGKLYQSYFKDSDTKKILIRDGFVITNNKDYPDSEPFSDLHITYKMESVDGFGDFLIVGDKYSETGGAAYAVAIHLTYLKPDRNMSIYHFKSDQNASPVDPAGKFQEALEKLITQINTTPSNIFNSNACQTFANLNDRGHFPGLGKVKEISMQHHIELMADFLNWG